MERALRETSDQDRRVSITLGLIHVDLNRYLMLLVDVLAEGDWELGEAKTVLTGHMDDTSRVLLEDLVRKANGKGFVVAVHLHEMVSDNSNSLQTLKDTVNARPLSVDELSVLLWGLAHSAYFNNDEATLPIVARYLDHENPKIRLSSVLALQMIPGNEARAMLVKTVSESKDGYREHFLPMLLENRDAMMTQTERRAPGWKPANNERG